MPLIPSFGTAQQTSDVAFLTQDMLNSMGSFMTQEVGSLNWVECYVNARALATAKNFVTLMANQLSPNSASIFLSQWAQIYNCLGLADQTDIENYIEARQAQFGTPPTLSNITEYFQDTLGEILIDLEVAPELQIFSTTDPYTDIFVEQLPYTAPLLRMLVYVWQQRDNKDNLLMPTNQFNGVVDSYHAYVEAWNPAYTEFQTMNLTNRGFQDGYCNNYAVVLSLTGNNYIDGYNVVSGTSGSIDITGTDTAFYLYPNGEIGDFQRSVVSGFTPPIQIVDDSGVLQTYFVQSIIDNTHLTLTSALINNITNRTYRCLGVVCDIVGSADGGQLISDSFITVA